MKRINAEYMPPVMFHPGVILAEKLKEMQMQVKEFSVRCQKPDKTIHAVLRGESSITPDMAVFFENVLKIPARFWLKAQRDYDEYLARKRQEVSNQKYETWMRCFPFSDMVKKKFISEIEDKTPATRIRILLEFFGIAKVEAWEDYYQNQTLCTAFRLSLAGMENQYSLSAWLRYGEIEVAKKNIGNQFSLDKLKANMYRFCDIANSCPDDFKDKLVSLCAEVGIVLVYTPHIKNSKAQGATRWVNSCPLVQISDCRKQYDIFWFSFFHELGHIILHNKKDIFLEGIEYSEKNIDKEHEADSFASEKLVPEKVVRQLRLIPSYSNEIILSISKKEKIHPAFLVGRMHHLKLLNYAIGNNLIPSVSFEIN